MFFPKCHDSKPNKYSTMAISNMTKGVYAIARSWRVGESRASNLNKCIVETMTDTTELKTELQSNPSAAQMRSGCVGWNSSKVNTADDSPASTAETTLRGM